MAHDLFISYSRKDEGIVKKLCSFFEEYDLAYWIDKQGINLSEDYKERIAQGIYKSDIFLFIWTENSNESTETAREIAIAQEYNKKIIPFKVGEFLPSFKLIYDLPRLQRVNTTEKNIDASVKELIEKVLEAKRQAATNSSSSHKYACYRGNQITEEMIVQAIEIDKIVYQSCYQGRLEQCLEWRKRNSEIYTMIQDVSRQKIIGYINAMPLEKEYYNLLKSGERIDVDTPAEFIQDYDMPDTHCLYFSSIAISPEYQNTGAFKILYDAFLEGIIELSNREIYFSELLADAVTNSGEKVCKYVGMQVSKGSSHESKIYTLSLLPPQLKTTTKISREIYRIYSQLYKEINDQ